MASTDLSDREAVRDASAVLLDWDGCLALGDRLQPDAQRFLAACSDRVAVVSNNTTRLPEEFSRILADAGTPIPPERILLAGTEALARAIELAPRRAMVLGDARMRAYGRKLGLNVTWNDPDVIVLLRDTRFSYSRLERATNGLLRGARLIVANPDRVHPGPFGRTVPETGALLAALMACVDPARIEYEVVGKPSPRLFERALAALGASAEAAVMIGDNPATDLAGAQGIGARGVLIGPSSPLTFDELTAAILRPA